MFANYFDVKIVARGSPSHEIVVGELHRVSTSMMRCRNPGSRNSKMIL